MLRVAPTDQANSKTNLTSVHAANNNKKKQMSLFSCFRFCCFRLNYLLLVCMYEKLLMLPFKTRLFLLCYHKIFFRNSFEQLSR